MNQVIIVGRLTQTPIKQELENKTKATFTLAVTRSWKNVNGEYEKDFIDCVSFSSIANSLCECCEKDDVVGVKGRLAKLENDNELRLIAEKVTFLSGKKEEEKND